MKKYCQLAVAFLFATFSMALFNSCEEETVESGYSYGIEFFEETSVVIEEELAPVSALTVISNYLNEVECLMTESRLMYFHSKTEEDNDRDAIHLFNVNVEKIDVAELERRMEGLNAKFTYLVIGGSSGPNEINILDRKDFKFGSYKE